MGGGGLLITFIITVVLNMLDASVSIRFVLDANGNFNFIIDILSGTGSNKS